MNEIIKIKDIEKLILEIRDTKVIIDSDVAVLYGVETKRVNEAVKNNPDKFPKDYVFELNENEKREVVENFDHLKKLNFSPYFPKVFTEKGLYMIATILKSKKATQTTFAIIEAFAKIRELARNINTLSTTQDKRLQEQLMGESGNIVSEILDGDLQTTDIETSVELNFAVLKFKHIIKKKK